MITASQKITRNPGGGVSNLFVMIEKVVLAVLKRFRFLEVGIVTEIDPNIARVRCFLPYQGRESKWLKVYMPFASNGEGIYAMPNSGDHGLVFFILGDLNAGIFINASWGGEIKLPMTDEPPQAKDIIIKRNGSWLRIRPNGIIDGVHKDGNRLRISDGFARVSTPDNQKAVTQKYFCEDRTAGSKEPLEAHAFSKIEAKNQKEIVEYRRRVDEPKGDIQSWFCIVDQEAPAYLPAVSSSTETVIQDRVHKYIDYGNNEQDLNILNYSRTRQLMSIPKGEDLLVHDGNVFEQNAEVAFQIWLGRKAYAWLAINISEKNDMRFAGFQVQVMADGRVENFEVQVNGNSPQDDGSQMLAFENAVKQELRAVEETDALPFPSAGEIERGEQRNQYEDGNPEDYGGENGGDFGGSGGEGGGDGSPDHGGMYDGGGRAGDGDDGGSGGGMEGSIAI